MARPSATSPTSHSSASRLTCFRTWGEANLAIFNQHYDFDRRAGHNHEQHRFRADPNSDWDSYHARHQEGEWDALNFAGSLAGREIAYRSMSSGAGQIMGFNHAKMGYPIAVAMFEAFAGSERAQVGSIFEFIERTPGLTAAVRAGDYASTSWGSPWRDTSPRGSQAGWARDVRRAVS